MKRKRKVEDILPDDRRSVKTEDPEKIKVRVHIPESVSETSRRRKINQIYDLLNPETSR